MGLIATTRRPCAIALISAGRGSAEAGKLKARSGTTGSPVAWLTNLVTISLLCLSRYDLYDAVRSAEAINTREVLDSTLTAPTLATTQGTPASLASMAHLKRPN